MNATSVSVVGVSPITAVMNELTAAIRFLNASISLDAEVLKDFKNVAKTFQIADDFAEETVTKKRQIYRPAPKHADPFAGQSVGTLYKRNRGWERWRADNWSDIRNGKAAFVGGNQVIGGNR